MGQLFASSMQTVRCRRSQTALHSPRPRASFDIDEAQQHRTHDKALDSIEFDHGSRCLGTKVEHQERLDEILKRHR